MTLSARSFPLILAAPSGTGKTSIARALKARRSDVVFSISATTRPPRSYEAHGRDYWFVDEAEFRRMADAGEMVEWASVHGNLYGTPRSNIDDAAARDAYLVLDIDVQGARQIRRTVPDAVSIFVLPPSGTALVDRLLGRGSESPDVRSRRLRNAATEVRLAPEFDYVVVNDSLDDAVAAVEGILETESCRVSRLPQLAAACEMLAEAIEAGVPGETAPVDPVTQQEMKR